MNTEPAGIKCYLPLQPSQTGQFTRPHSLSGSVRSVNGSTTMTPGCAACIESLLYGIRNHLPLFSRDVYYHKINKKLLASKIKILTTNYGYQAGVQLLSQWPENKKGQTWFYMLASCLFNHRESSVCEAMIAELTPCKDSTEAPIAVYLTVLKKIQGGNGLHSPVGFREFMDWLVCWNISEVQPRIDLLKNIPDEIRKLRPDLPIIQGSEIKIALEPGEGWGAFRYSLQDYLVHTRWIQHCMICAFIEYAPLDFVQPVIESWLEADETTAIRDKLFAQEQHPLTVDFFELKPWNIMLKALDRLLPGFESEFSQDISKLNGSDQSVEQMDKSFTDRLNLPRKSFVFGRTIAFLDPDNQGHLYLKVQSGDESDSMFFKEAQRLNYFYENREQLCITGSALSVEGVFKTDSLKAILSKYQLSYVDRARLLLRCEKGDHFTVLNKALLETTDQKAIDDVIKDAKKTHRYNLLADDTPLSGVNKWALINYLNKNDKSCHMMLLRAPAGYNYEQYIYDSGNHDSVMEGLTRYVEEFGTMWSEGVLGPDSCSVFHDKDDGRDYHFLAPYFGIPSVGTVDQWAGLSTDFPNVGPAGCRDRGDARAVSELNTEKLFDWLGEGEDQDRLLARGSLEALAKAAWGTILLYGRSLRETFNSNNSDKVAGVQKDAGEILGTLFSSAFHLPLERCLELMNSQNLLAQTAREISYWMTTDYVADLRNGLIPETVYPDYKGTRDGHVLTPRYNKFLSDDGFKGDYPSVHLGTINGKNPLMALDSMVVKMLSHGCLNFFKTHK